MTKNLKLFCLMLFPLTAAAIQARSQSIPAPVSTAPGPGVGFQLPRVGGSLTYALSAAELVSTGFYSQSGTTETTNFSGDLAYVSKNANHPFSAVYAGGLLLGNNGQPTTTFQSLSFSQILNFKRWNFAAADTVSYLPQSPTMGLSGIPGVGDLGVDPVSVGPTAGIGILTVYGPRVSNTATGSVSRMLTSRISAQASGNYGIQRFIGDNSYLGLDNTTTGGSAGVSYHFSGRSTVTGNYNYSNFSYTGTAYSFSTQGGTIDYSRQWSRRFSTEVYAGPQIILGSNSIIGSSSIQVAAGASASYLDRITTYSLSYSRGVNNGSGVILGSFSNNLILGAHRKVARVWDVSGTLGYTQFSSLPNATFGQFSGQSFSAGGQGARAFGKRLSAYASYTIQHQSTSGYATGANAFSGNYQIFGFGVTYSPAALLLGR